MCVADPHVLDQLWRAEAALLEILNCLAVAVQLHAIEIGSSLYQRRQASPLVQQRHRRQELHVAIVLDKANHVTATATAVAIEQALRGIHQEAGFVIAVQRAQSYQSTPAQLSGRLPIMCLQIVQKGNLLFQLLDGLATHGLLASSSRVRQ
jgi:hypothetical protein